jgi:hypothetical protein
MLPPSFIKKLPCYDGGCSHVESAECSRGRFLPNLQLTTPPSISWRMSDCYDVANLEIKLGVCNSRGWRSGGEQRSATRRNRHTALCFIVVERFNCLVGGGGSISSVARIVFRTPLISTHHLPTRSRAGPAAVTSVTNLPQQPTIPLTEQDRLPGC